MPPGRPIMRPEPIGLRDFIMKVIGAFNRPCPESSSNQEPYFREGLLTTIPGNTSTILVSDRAPATRNLLLRKYFVFAADPVAKDFITISIQVNGIDVFPTTNSSLWKVSQPVEIAVRVARGSSWALVATNASGTPGQAGSTPLDMQAAVIGELL